MLKHAGSTDGFATCIVILKQEKQHRARKQSCPVSLTLRPSQVQVHGKEKRAANDSFSLVEATGLAVCYGCALHTDSSPTVASDGSRLAAPR